jgi:hypothetical protein
MAPAEVRLDGEITRRARCAKKFNHYEKFSMGCRTRDAAEMDVASGNAVFDYSVLQYSLETPQTASYNACQLSNKKRVRCLCSRLHHEGALRKRNAKLADQLLTMLSKQQAANVEIVF